MSNNSIDFNDLNFNLYQILAIDKDADEKKIKRSYRKLIMKFHPDKGDKYNEDIYNHLTIAKQVLTDPVLRREYDNYLINSNDYKQLKDNFYNESDIVKQNIPVNKKEAQKEFFEINDELNKKHGYDESLNNKDLMKELEKMNNQKLDIEYEELKNTDELNKKFDERKLNDGLELGHFEGDLMESNYNFDSNYCGVDDYNLLYQDDSIETGNFTSLDRAFIVTPKIDYVDEDVDERMKRYKQERTNI